MNNAQLNFYCPSVPCYCCLGTTHHSKSLESPWPHINPTPYWFPLESKFYPFFLFIYFLLGRYWTCKRRPWEALRLRFVWEYKACMALIAEVELGLFLQLHPKTPVWSLSPVSMLIATHWIQQTFINSYIGLFVCSLIQDETSPFGRLLVLCCLITAQSGLPEVRPDPRRELPPAADETRSTSLLCLHSLLGRSTCLPPWSFAFELQNRTSCWSLPVSQMNKSKDRWNTECMILTLIST